MRVSFAVMAVCLLSVTAEDIRKGKVNIKKAMTSGFVNQMSSEAVNGEMQFGLTQMLTVEIEGYNTKEVLIKKQNIKNKMQKRKNTEMNVDAAIYADDSMTTTCINKCDMVTRICTLTCLKKESDESCYLNSEGKALCFANGIDAAMQFRKMPELETVVPSSGRRRRRSIEPNLNETGIIKIAMFPDDSFMDVFMQLANNSIAQAKTECEKYLTLVINEVSLSYQTLMSYGLNYTLDGESNSRQLDLSLYLAGIEYPTDNGTRFINTAWSADNKEGDNVYEDTLANEYQGILSDFKNFIGNRDSSLNAYFDHAIGLTGYDFYARGDGTGALTPVINVAGIAWLSSLCNLGAKLAGYTTSMLESSGLIVLLIAHELGHGIGAEHDSNNECPTTTYIMSSSLFTPTLANKDTFYKFSRCSAVNITDHLESLSNAIIDDTCLFDTSVSDDEFLANFCLGTIGTGLSLDEQCQVAKEWSGSRHCELSGYPIGAVKHCVYNSTSFQPYPAYCTVVDNNNCYSVSRVYDGTPCQPDGETAGTKVCYQGNCVSKFDICTSQNTTDKPTPTPTDPPTPTPTDPPTPTPTDPPTPTPTDPPTPTPTDPPTPTPTDPPTPTPTDLPTPTPTDPPTPKPNICKKRCRSRKCCRKYRKNNGNCCRGCEYNRNKGKCVRK